MLDDGWLVFVGNLKLKHGGFAEAPYFRHPIYARGEQGGPECSAIFVAEECGLGGAPDQTQGRGFPEACDQGSWIR